MAPPWADSGGPNPSVFRIILTHAWHKTMFFLRKISLGRSGPPMGDTGGPKYGTSRHTNGGYPGSGASKLSSALSDVTSDAAEVSSGASKVSYDATELSSDAP